MVAAVLRRRDQIRIRSLQDAVAAESVDESWLAVSAAGGGRQIYLLGAPGGL